jgi:hypothetical protein
MIDFNNAQRSVIPADTIATLHLKVRPGNAGEDNSLTRSKDGNSEALDCEFIVVDGPFAKRKFWDRFLINGTTEGHAQAAEITQSRLRAILESARGIKPDDMSDIAKQARKVAGFAEFDGLRFIGRVGIEPASDKYPAKNTFLAAVTPDQQDWYQVEQVAKQPGAPAAPAAPKAELAKIVRPAWAS